MEAKIKRYILITFLLLLISQFLFSQTSRISNENKRKNIFISNLINKTSDNPKLYDFYSSAISRSIAAVLARYNKAKFYAKEFSDSDLLEMGFTHKISGEYAVNGTKMSVNFTVSVLKQQESEISGIKVISLIEKSMAIIVSNSKGFSSIHVYFPLVDKISENFLISFQKPLSNDALYTTAINISNEGEITSKEGNLSEANLSGFTFNNKNLSKNDISKGIFNNASFKDAILNNINAEGSSFTNANMENASLLNSNFSNANLTGADLRGARLKGINLTRANLTNAHLGNIDLERDDPAFKNAILDGALFDRRKFYLNIIFTTSIQSWNVKSIDPIEDRYRTQISPPGANVEGMYFFNHWLGLRLSGGIKFSELKHNNEISPYFLDFNLHLTLLHFELSVIFRPDRFYFQLGFYTDVRIKFEGHSKDFSFNGYEMGGDEIQKVNAGFLIYAGYAFRLSRILNIILGVSFTKDFKGVFTDKYKGIRFSNIYPFSINIHLGIMFGLL